MNRIVAAFGWVPVLALLCGSERSERSASAQTQENGIVYEGPAPTQAQAVQPGTAQPVPQGTQQAIPQGPQPGAPPGVVPPPPSPQPAPPPSDAAQAQAAQQGQWMNTENGWIWVPAGAQTYPVDGVPYAYLYSPAYGWTWFASPWGWGPYAYGPWIYHPWPYGFRAWARGAGGWGWRGGVGRYGGGGYYGGHGGYAGHYGGGHYSGGGHFGGGHGGGAHGGGHR
jgi:hypothetical protein